MFAIAAANQTAYLLFASAKILAGRRSYQTAAANVQDMSWRCNIFSQTALLAKKSLM